MNDEKLYKNKEWLYDQYWNKQKSMKKIEKETGCTSIYYWLKKFNILRRNRYESQALILKNRINEKEHRYMDKKWLENQYIVLELSATKIGKKEKVTHNTILKWLKKFKIKIRTISEASDIRFKNIQENPRKHYAVEHAWVRRNKPKKDKCEKCKKDKKLQLSFNHSLGIHTRNIEDYKWLCQSCHAKKDWHEFKIMNNQHTVKRLKK